MGSMGGLSFGGAGAGGGGAGFGFGSPMAPSQPATNNIPNLAAGPGMGSFSSPPMQPQKPQPQPQEDLLGLF